MELLDLLLAPYDFLNWTADRAFVAMKALYDRFGPPMVFFAALIEATAGLGVVFPGVVLIFLGGAFAGERGTPIAVVLALAIAGTAIGDTISYALGRWGGGRLEGTRLGERLRAGGAVLSGRARWLIPFYHLNNWTRAVGPAGAGALRLPLRVWMPLDYLGAALSNTAWVGAGWLLGRAVLTEDGTLQQHPALRIGLAVAAVAWYLAARHVFARGRRRSRERPEDGGAGEG